MPLKKSSEKQFLSEDSLDALIQLPLPFQVAFLRRSYGTSQNTMAEGLNIKQAQMSLLEQEKTDHLVSQYQKIAAFLNCRLALIPKNVQLKQRTPKR